jgi:hypothetical protein
LLYFLFKHNASCPLLNKNRVSTQSSCRSHCTSVLGTESALKVS